MSNLPKPRSRQDYYQNYLAGYGNFADLLPPNPDRSPNQDYYLYEQCVNRDVVKLQVLDMVRYNVKQNELYDIDHVDVAINDIISKMVAGDEMILPWGNYNFTSTLKFVDLKEGCRVILNGTLNAVGSFSPAMKVSGSGFKLSLNKMLSNINPDATYSNIVNDGLVLGDKGCSNAVMDINIIEGFLTGISPCPNNSNGIQYNKISYNWIRNCKTCILLSTGSAGISWVNENTFIGGKLSGYHGVRTVKGTNQTDAFNNNKFYNVGFETLKGDALTLSFAAGNSFINTRMCESILGMYIIDDATCKQNLFIISHLLPLDKLNLVGAFTRVIAPINNTISDTWLYSGFIINFLGVKKFDIIEPGLQNFSNVNGTVKADTKTITVSTDTAPVVITLPKDAEFIGNEIVLKDAWHVNTITINKWDGSEVVAPGVINGYGRWILKRNQTAWEAYIMPYKMDVIAPSVAVDIATLKADFNNLITKLKYNGYMKTS